VEHRDLAGTLVLAVESGTTYADLVGKSYAIVAAGGTITGTFASAALAGRPATGLNFQISGPTNGSGSGQELLLTVAALSNPSAPSTITIVP